MWYFRAIRRDLVDLAIATHDLVTGQQRREYRCEVVVDAPKDIVRSIITRADVTYEQGAVRVVTEPLPGIEGGEIAQTFIGARAYPAVASRRSEPLPDTFVWHCLPELSHGARGIGEDDTSETTLESLPDGATRMRCRRVLTHRRAGTRISAPMGLRVSAWRIKRQAESEAGRPPPARSRLDQLGWLLAAIASFWWLLGWRDAAILVLVIVMHELGHAAAMLATGRGVRLITLVPFFGGMAFPKRRYETQWQRALVALMGPGLSLVPTLALVWLAYSTDSVLAAHAAFLSAAVNVLNLLPLVPLDGGIVIDSLLRSLHGRLSQVIAWLGIGAGLAFAVYAQSVLIGLVFAFGALQLLYQSSLDTNAHLERLTGVQASLLIVALVATVAAYATIVRDGYPSPGANPGFGGEQARAGQIRPAD
jgi:Zn-dependent protease